jgi:two-component system, OmpR family, sensor histidine kinase KdpD
MMSDARNRGGLKVFLGYAAGVGKTYQMLTEAHELKVRGVDVVIGYFEPHGRKETIPLSEGLETVPRKVVEYRGGRFEEMDTDATLRRHPEVAIVDEFPHTNVPGSARLKRWEDVHALLDAWIDVLTTMNVQHLESLNDQIWQSTGVRVRETIPDWVLKRADEVVMVDLTPGALLNRLARGVVYAPERAEAALQNFFKESTLVALRELAMRQAAHVVESRVPSDEESSTSRSGPIPEPQGHERLLLVIGPDPSSAALIRRGRRVADYLRAECPRYAFPALLTFKTCLHRSATTWNVTSILRAVCRSRHGFFREPTWPRRSSTSRGSTASPRSSSRERSRARCAPGSPPRRRNGL